jgi:hypothetical protein
MAAPTYDLLREHIGHAIVCVCYGIDDEDPDNIAIECETCNEVLFDLHKDEHYEKFVPPSVEVVETDNSIHYDEEQLPIDADKVLKQIEDSIPPGQKVIVVSTPAPNPNPLFEEAQKAGLVGKVETWKARPDKIPERVYKLGSDKFRQEYQGEFPPEPGGNEALMEALAQKEDAEFKKHAELCLAANPDAKPETPAEMKKRIESYPLKPDGPIIGMTDQDFRALAAWTNDSGLFNNCPDCGCAEPTNIDGRYDFDERRYTWWCMSCGHSETRAVDGLTVAMLAQADTVIMAQSPRGGREPIAFTEEALRKAAEEDPLRLFYVPQTKSLWALRQVDETFVVSESMRFDKRIETFSMGALVKPDPVPSKCPKCGRNDLLISVPPEKHDGNNFHCGNCLAFWKHNMVGIPVFGEGTRTGRFDASKPNYSNVPKAEDPVFKDEENGLWFFWNEVWADRPGPYETEEDARAALKEYCETHLQAKKED